MTSKADQAPAYKLILPFDMSFFEEAKARGIEARFIMSRVNAGGDYYEHVAWLTAMDEDGTLLEAKRVFYVGHNDTPKNSIEVKKIKDLVDKLSIEAGVTVRTGRWIPASPKDGSASGSGND